MTRILCVWFPLWSITRRRRDAEVPAAGPLATGRRVRGRPVLGALSSEAEAAGLRPDMALDHALAVLPGLLAVEDDPAADLAGLNTLVAWARRYTHRAVADTTHGPVEGLLLDITACAAAFGGEAALLADLSAHLATFGLPARMAIAGTSGAAWALSRSTEDSTILPPGGEARALANLPTDLLRLPEPLTAALNRLCLRRIGALARIPQAELAARFGTLPGERLAQALGSEAEPITWPHAPAPWQVRAALCRPPAPARQTRPDAERTPVWFVPAVISAAEHAMRSS